jgi:curved DNA-binding protein CbpA
MTDHHRNWSGDDLYRRLEVEPEASRVEIVRAYRRLAHGAHPDAQPGDPDAARRFRGLTEAYEVLSDEERRARYDRARPDVGPSRLSGSGAGRPSPALRVSMTSSLNTTADPLGGGSAFPAWSTSKSPLIWAGPTQVEPAPATVPRSSRPDSIGAGLEELVSVLHHWLEGLWG